MLSGTRCTHEARTGIRECFVLCVLCGGQSARRRADWAGLGSVTWTRSGQAERPSGIRSRSARTLEEQKALYAKIAELVGEYAGTERGNVFVTIHENQFADWSFGNGVAQYLERPQ